MSEVEEDVPLDQTREPSVAWGVDQAEVGRSSDEQPRAIKICPDYLETEIAWDASMRKRINVDIHIQPSLGILHPTSQLVINMHTKSQTRVDTESHFSIHQLRWTPVNDSHADAECKASRNKKLERDLHMHIRSEANRRPAYLL